MMKALDKDLRGALEKAVKAARTVAETAAQAAVGQLGVGQDKPEAFLGEPEKALRNRLRTHGKQLGDSRDSKSNNPTYGKQELQHLVQEVAYQHWHRMLFARFLADNNLLIYDGVAVTIEECDELAPDEGAKSGWELAGKLAARMLPQVFKPGSPVFELTFAPEHQSELELLLKALPDAVFKASDSLGWVYQFWQADNKDRINKSEVKIGADELPAVTQLFTEPYMVAFLLHNSLGAWWATRHQGKPCPVKLEYFRSLEDGSPAGGKFEGWPDSLAEFKLLDPCCGSGHFLVAAFLLLVPMRMAAEGLSAKDAVNRVLAENMHGLELDQRCVEIAVFAVALEAWRYPDASGKPLGVREIPAPSIACCGLKVAAKAQDWEALVPDEAPNAEYVRQELRQLHASFSNAPLLGSLLDPARSLKNDLAMSSYQTLTVLLRKALATERPQDLLQEEDDRWELALSAQGLLEAARILDTRFHLVVTNVPYLGRADQCDELRQYIENHFPKAQGDLANVFLDRALELIHPSCSVQLVMPRAWMFLPTYQDHRIDLLEHSSFRLLAVLGPRAFETITGEVVNVCLATFSNTSPSETNSFVGIDADKLRTPAEKATELKSGNLITLSQKSQLSHPGARISLEALESKDLLARSAIATEGLSTGDGEQFLRFQWEQPLANEVWSYYQAAPTNDATFSGFHLALKWMLGKGPLADSSAARIQGHAAWGRQGVLIARVDSLRAVPYFGYLYDKSCVALTSGSSATVSALRSYGASADFRRNVRKLDKKKYVTTSVFLGIPFRVDEWVNESSAGLPYSNDPTQWIFHGHPTPSTDPLQVAVARLVGHSWPAEADQKMALSEDARSWIAKSGELAGHADSDGIVCIPPVGREPSAGERLLNLLAAAYGDAWSNDTLGKLLVAADHAGKSLETWLRDKFFAQHCALFGGRPFVWHVWDGLRDGFAALLNYQKLDYKTLEALIYTYLGDWIGRQKRDAENGVDGAQERLAAAEALKKRLELILEGDAPYDIFVRWKPIDEQPIGWNPDVNDGVRMNIRPFLSVPDVGKRGAGVLRDKPKGLHWEKDRGADPAEAPWYELGPKFEGKKGDRINDHHLTLADKRAARSKLGKA